MVAAQVFRLLVQATGRPCALHSFSLFFPWISHSFVSFIAMSSPAPAPSSPNSADPVVDGFPRAVAFTLRTVLRLGADLRDAASSGAATAQAWVSSFVPTVVRCLVYAVSLFPLILR